MVGEALDLAAVRFDLLRQGAADAARLRVDDPGPRTLQGSERGDRTKLAQPLGRTCRQIHARRVGAVDDVDIVVAGKADQEGRELGVERERVEQLGPLRRHAGIGHVSGKQDVVERLGGVNFVEPGQRLSQPFVPARARATALYPEAVTLADRMEVGDMRDAPRPAAPRWRIEGAQVARLRHRRVGEAPNQRGEAEIGRDDDDGVGERQFDQGAQRGELGESDSPPGVGPGERNDAERDRAEQDARHRGTGGADGGAAGRAHAPRQPLLDDLPESFAADDVKGLDAQRVERPEARLGEPQQRTPAEPSEADEDRDDDEGRDAGQDIGDP